MKRASLHNADQIEKLDLYFGDLVQVEKGGEIIPKIVGVNLDLRTSGLEKINFILNCPECGTLLIKRKGEAQHFCPNDVSCPPQIKGRIDHFTSRKAMNIEGIGSETIEMLVDKGLISSYADIYDLTFDQVVSLDRMADKSADNLIKGVEASKTVPFECVLFALGIRYVGQTVAKKLAKYFKNIDAIVAAKYDDLVSVDEIGEKIAISVQQFFLKKENLVLIERLKKAGLQFAIEEKENKSSKFEGETFVVSGVFASFSRNEIKELIEINGGKNSSSISSKTSYVVAGENMGPAKLKKATDLGVSIISESEFVKMLGENY